MHRWWRAGDGKRTAPQRERRRLRSPAAGGVTACCSSGDLGDADFGFPEQRSPLRGNHVFVPFERILRDALLAGVIDVHEPKALLVTIGPLEAVEKRPGIIAADPHALLDGSRELEKRAAHVVDALRVVNLAIEKDLVAGGETIFGDGERHAITIVKKPGPPVEATGNDGLPVDPRARIARPKRHE